MSVTKPKERYRIYSAMCATVLLCSCKAAHFNEAAVSSNPTKKLKYTLLQIEQADVTNKVTTTTNSFFFKSSAKQPEPKDAIQYRLSIFNAFFNLDEDVWKLQTNFDSDLLEQKYINGFNSLQVEKFLMNRNPGSTYGTRQFLLKSRTKEDRETKLHFFSENSPIFVEVSGCEEFKRAWNDSSVLMHPYSENMNSFHFFNDGKKHSCELDQLKLAMANKAESNETKKPILQKSFPKSKRPTKAKGSSKTEVGSDPEESFSFFNSIPARFDVKAGALIVESQAVPFPVEGKLLLKPASDEFDIFSTLHRTKDNRLLYTVFKLAAEQSQDATNNVLPPISKEFPKESLVFGPEFELEGIKEEQWLLHVKALCDANNSWNCRFTKDSQASTFDKASGVTITTPETGNLKISFASVEEQSADMEIIMEPLTHQQILQSKELIQKVVFDGPNIGMSDCNGTHLNFSLVNQDQATANAAYKRFVAYYHSNPELYLGFLRRPSKWSQSANVLLLKDFDSLWSSLFGQNKTVPLRLEPKTTLTKKDPSRLEIRAVRGMNSADDWAEYTSFVQSVFSEKIFTKAPLNLNADKFVTHTGNAEEMKAFSVKELENWAAGQGFSETNFPLIWKNMQDDKCGPY